jgi:hypothetical protein
MRHLRQQQRVFRVSSTYALLALLQMGRRLCIADRCSSRLPCALDHSHVPKQQQRKPADLYLSS